MTCPTIAGVTMTGMGSFSISGTKPATGQVGYYGNAVAFVPAGADLINQDTLVITWAQTDPMNPSRRLFLFHRITIVPNNGTPAILCTATIPSDLAVAGGTFGTASLVKDLVYDAASRKLVGVVNANGQRFFAFDLFSTNVTVSSLACSAATGDTQSPTEVVFQGANGDYTSFYTPSTTTNWRKISIGRNQLNGATAFTKIDTAKTLFTGWWPDPAASPSGTDSKCATGAASFYGSTALIIREFRNSANANAQECRLYLVGNTLDAAAINAYTDLGAVPALNGNYIGYGMAFDKIGGKVYIRSGYTNDSGSASWNKIFMAQLTVDADTTAANAVADLAVTGIEQRALTIGWTVPADMTAVYDGPVRYDIRYSTAPIDDTNWDAATQVTSEPPPGPTGASDAMRISGLTAATDYWFALRTIDTAGNVSLTSNIATGRTQDPDITPPAAVSDLTYSDLHPNSLVLHWSATGDDGMTGTAASYDLRCSTSPIDDSNFLQATSIALGAPKALGSAESIDLHNLTAGVTYYFAIKVSDEWPNTSAISNLLAVQMPPPPPSGPEAIVDLQVVGIQSSSASLRWTAPAGVGSGGVQGCEIRYSTAPITDANWASATVVANPPAAPTPGTTVSATVKGLVGNTTYHFAVKSFDWAEPANWSTLSNVPSATTTAPILPVALHNPWIVSDRVADCRSLSTLAATFANAYTPDGMIVPSPTDTQTIAINSYNNFKRREYHWADDPVNRGDVVRNINIHGHSLCGGHASQMASIHQAQGIRVRTGSIASGAHTLYEVFWDNDWHLMDTMTTMYVFDRANPPSIASAADIKADKTLMTSAAAEGRACPGYLLCPDDVTWFANGTNSWSVIGEPGATATTHLMDMDLHFGQTLDRTWNAWQNQHPTPVTDADGGNLPGPDAPYHHDAQNDWKDIVNFKYWEPYGAVIPYIHTTKTTYRRWSNGTHAVRPDFSSTAYQSMVFGTPVSISTLGADGLLPELHPSAANVTSEIVFKVKLPFEITDAGISGDFLRKTGSDLCRLYISTNGTSYTQLWEHTGLGTTTLTNLNIRSTVFGKFEYYIKVQMKGFAARNDAGVSGLVINNTFQHNKGAMAYLDKGINNITVTFDNPAELAASGAGLKVTYQWKEFDGTGWTIARSHERYIPTSPFTFSLTTGGTKVPRTESIKMELVEPAFDPAAPAAIINLAAGTAQTTKVPLTWTATGDDGATGTAQWYELRYSTTQITDDASFNAATLAAGLFPPLPAGATETFTLSGLTGGTTYFIAVKAFDELGKGSPLSNVITVMTQGQDIRPPEPVTDLAAIASAVGGGIDLTWSAPADYGNGGVGPYTCAGYDVRYSTSPIDDTNWDTATQAAGEPAPKAPGQPETFTVTGLAGRTLYYFAVKAIDDAGNISLISNTAEAVTATRQVVLNPVADLGLYSGGGAEYSNRGTGGRFDIGATQSALLKFDVAAPLAADEMIVGATLQFSDLGMGSGFNFPQVVGYPLVAAWQEGIGNAGAVGDTGYPWGPASIGDAVWLYQQATAVGPGTGSFATKTVATDGILWNTPGGRGIGTDVVDRRLFSASWPGSATPLVFTAEGAAVLRAWSTGMLENHGLNVWPTSGSGYAALSSREYNGVKPQLILTIGVAGDINGDGHVDVLDLLYFADSFGRMAGEPGYNVLADFNGDQSADVIDLLILAGTFGI